MSRNIKSEKIIRVMIIPGQEEKIDLSEGFVQSQHEYDPEGHLRMEISYGGDGSVTEKNEFTYDEQGRLTGSVIYGDEDEALETRKLIRDETGEVTSEEIIYMDGSVDTIHYKYSNGLMAEKIHLNEDEEVESKEVYEYEGDQLVLFERYDIEGHLVHQVRNTYKDGKITESRVNSSENEEPYNQLIRYNEAGRRTEEMRYDKRDRLIEKNSYEEDGSGRVVRMVEENTSRKNTTEISYDDSGQLSRQVETDMRGQVLSDIERNYGEDGLPEATRVLVLDRLTGLHQQYVLVYEYEFYDES